MDVIPFSFWQSFSNSFNWKKSFCKMTYFMLEKSHIWYRKLVMLLFVKLDVFVQDDILKSEMQKHNSKCENVS